MPLNYYGSVREAVRYMKNMQYKANASFFKHKHGHKLPGKPMTKKYRQDYKRKYGKRKAPKKPLNPQYNSKPRKGGKKVKTLSNRVSKLEREKNKDWSFKTLRRVDCSTNKMSFNNEGFVTSNPFVTGTDLQTGMSALKFFNPSAPATLITTDLKAGTYPQDILAKWYRKVDFVNNYQVAVYLEVWRCDVKLDTTIAPQQAWINGCADNPSGALDIDDMYVYPSDSKELNDLYKVKKVFSQKLQPGQGLSTFANSKGYINFDPATFDDHANNFQRQYQGGGFLVKTTGIIAHDSIAAEVGFSRGGVDIIQYTVTTIKYDSGGASLRDVTVANNCDSFSNLPVVSNKPASDNQAFTLL